jgi:enoyl-CoA hydratase/carnithine racemase
MSEDSQHILDRQYDGVLEITFNRPKKKNSSTVDMYQRLHALIKMAEQDDAIHVVYIRGHEGCFCAGNDVADLAAGMQSSGQGAGDFMGAMINMKKPMVAAVSGFAIGIGATLLFHCDFIYADDSAILRTPFTLLGVCPEAGSSYALPARIGEVRAAGMLLRGLPMNARQALECGLISEIFPAKSLHKEAEKCATELAALPARSMQITKQLMRRQYAENSQSAFNAEMQGFKELLASPDAQAAFAGFLNK